MKPIEEKCPANHPDDETPCSGPVLVMVLDSINEGARGCEHHASRLLASLDKGRVYSLPHAPAGTCMRVFLAASGMSPFSWRVESSEKAGTLRSMMI